MVTLPRIHLNGTNGKDLLLDYVTAVSALDRAILAVLDITVHGRDYYIVSDSALASALDEHREHLRKLNDVRDELQKIRLDLLKQNSDRAIRKQSGDIL